MFRSLVVVLFGLSILFTSAFAQESSWDKSLAFPPAMRERDVLLAQMEMLPENINRTKVVLLSEHVAEKESGIYAEIRFVSAQSRDKALERNLFTKQIYIEKSLNDEYSIYFMGYHDQEFRSGGIGLARKFGDFQLGLGIGSAKYDGLSRTVVNPWVFYESGKWSALVTADHYSKEEVEPWWYKGYVEYKMTDQFFAGVYGEKGSGLGPMLGIRPVEGLKLWVSVPIVSTPKRDENGEVSGKKLFVGLTYEF